MGDETRSFGDHADGMEQLWEQIGISNDFLFGKVMRSRPGLCRKLLQRILPELDIARIEVIETQKTIDEDRDARSVRLDVYVRDETDRVYSIEMQMADTRELPRRSRYYQGMIDLQLLEKGLTYRYLNDTYIIFICPFDLYETGRHRYTFAGTCAEDPEVTIQDGTVRIFLNAKGTMNDVSSSLKAFLDYVAGTVTEDPFVQELEEAVTEARKNRKWRHEYMTLLMRDQDNLEKGREEGERIGREHGERIGREHGERQASERYSRLILILNGENKADQIVKIASDPKYREELYRKYGI